MFWLLIDIGFQLVSQVSDAQPAAVRCVDVPKPRLPPCLQVGFVVSVLIETDKFFDLTGSLSFFIIALASLIYGGSYHGRQIAVTTLVCVWSARLGSFLFKRVLAAGSDSRFDEIKGNPRTFLRPTAV